MKKLLLITNQAEYSEHGTITPLFDHYLKEFYKVDIVFITSFKDSFQEKGSHFIVPQMYENNIIEYLARKNIDINSYNFVLVRNKRNLLKNVLDNRSKYNYKVGFRISFPYKSFAYDFEDSVFPINLIKKFIIKQKIKARDNMINQCDLFMPTSTQTKAEFYDHITIDMIPIFTGLDPENLNEHIVSKEDVTKFIYVGGISKNRQFETILDSFDALKNDKWSLTISTTDKTYITNLLKKYPKLKSHIDVISAISLEKLREQVNACDIGLALMPRNRYFDTIVPKKAMDYYACSIPAMLTNNVKNHRVFGEDEAFFCEFEKDKITNKLQELMDSPSTQDAKVGNKGQKKLLNLKRNYKILAKDLADKLDNIIKGK
ncbi:MAG: glycosyltransferase [Epsilonproteobacteria bacterium]|nr:MAG: glycosyltransferase [Campylobacterota bacterium]